MHKQFPIPGLTIYGGDGHFSGSFEDDGKHAGHTLDGCPFCGSNRLQLTNTHTPSYWVRCLKCDAEAHGDLPAGGGSAIPDARRALTLHLRAMRMAVRKWNKRVVDAADNSAAVAAIQFAIDADEGMAWLNLWNEGEFEACRREWPEAPDECYIGADQFFTTEAAAEGRS